MVGLIGWGRFYKFINGVQQFSPDGRPQRITTPLGLYKYLRTSGASIFPNFDILQLPPDHKAQGGDGDGCDGYEAYDWRDLGTKNQQGSVETRYGSLQEELALVACAHSYGTQVYGDLTFHQMGGDSNGVLTYYGADGKTKNGRGAKSPGDFRGQTSWNATKGTWYDPIPPFAPHDDVPVPADDYPFGRETSPQKGNPSLLKDMIDLVGWKTKRLSMDGYRFDDTKGTNAGCVKGIMDSVALPFYSEYFDGNPANLNWWATSSPMNGRSMVEDFNLHFGIQAACNGFDATKIFTGYWQWRPDLSVVFVDNPDTDTSDGQQVVFNKGLAYAFMLNIPCRIALVYGKDYFPSSVWPGAYGLKPIIDNLCWISRTFAFGAFQQRWVDKDVWAYTRDGNGGPVGWSGGLLMAGNFNVLSQRTITVQTMWAPGTWVHDYSGYALQPDLNVGANGMLTFTLRSNAYSSGTSFVAYAPGGVSRPFTPAPINTTQTFFGSSDLDVMPVTNGVQALPQQLYCKAGTTLNLHLLLASVPVGAIIRLSVLGPLSTLLGTTRVSNQGVATLAVKIETTGAHTLVLNSIQIPVEGINFELNATYTGTTEG